MSINLKSTQSCLESIGFLLSLAEIALPDKKLIAVGWHYNDLEGLDTWVAFNIYTSPLYTGFLYNLNTHLKIRELRHVIRSLQDTVYGLFTGANDFKVLYEGVEGWQDVTFETDPNWNVIKLLPLFMKENDEESIAKCLEVLGF